MVNNSTNINKTDSHLSHQTIEHTKRLSWLEIQVQAGNRDRNVAVLSRLMDTNPLFDNWISNNNTDINDNKKLENLFQTNVI